MTAEKPQKSAPATNSVVGGRASELPWLPLSAQMHDHVMTVAGIPTRKFYWDAKVFMDAYREMVDYYAIDILNPIADVYNFEIEAMGGKMVYSENAMPTIDFRDPLIKQPEDLHKLKTPDFYKDGRLLFAMDCLRLSQSLQGSFCGIFSMAVGMRTYPALIKDMRKRPEFAHELFTFIIDRVLIPFLKVQKEHCGISVAYGANAWASLPNLSVKEMREWIVPYHQQLADKAREFGVTVTTGGGDYCEEDLAKFDKAVLFDCFDVQRELRGGNSLQLGMGRWHEYPLEPVREYMHRYRSQGVRFKLSAGVNARLLRDGPAEMIVDNVKRFIDAFARDHELLVSLGNVPADTPADHVHAAVAALHIYGRLPIADSLDKVRFELPKRETFQEWKMKRAV